MPDPIQYLRAIQERIGRAPRKLDRSQSSPLAFREPHWLASASVDDDPIKLLFSEFEEIWKNGVIVWGYVLRMNVGLFEPGFDDLPGAVLFSPTAPPEVALEALPVLKDRLRALCAVESPQPQWTQRERDWREDLKNDMSYQKGVRLPEAWLGPGTCTRGDREFKGTTFLFHREHLHRRRILSRLLPIIVEPSTSIAQTIPATYWPPGMAEWMEKEHGFETGVSNLLHIADDCPNLDHLAPLDHEAREKALIQVFGPVVSVLHELVMQPHHIDVYRFEWGAPRNEWAYISAGMSDAMQPDPENAEFSRVELLFYSYRHDPRFAEMVRHLAHFPWQTGHSINPWRTIALGNDAVGCLGTQRFPGLLFVPGVSQAETAIHQTPGFKEQGIRILTIIPITQQELAPAENGDVGRLADRMQATNFDLTFDTNRKSLL